MKKKVFIGIGTRPEAIKMAALILELRENSQYDVIVCSTGQHKEMLDGVLSFFGITADVDFALMNQSKNILDLASQTMSKLGDYIEAEQPDVILGQGDTTTALMMGLAAYYKKIPFVHVEAGLRTGDLYSPWPEEGNRKMLSAIATAHIAPTPESKENLFREGVDPANIYVTGNTVIDALLLTADKAQMQPERLRFLDSAKKTVLLTSHRRENMETHAQNIFGALSDLVGSHPDVQFVFPMHPSPSVRKNVELVFGVSTLPSNLFLIEPLEYPDFVWLMNQSYLIVTDSGGIQEEAPSLGKPVLVIRDTTERPEGVTAGTVKLIGTDRGAVVSAVTDLLTNEIAYNQMSEALNPYGDGTAAKQIHAILQSLL